ncbi:hypothetical protein TraAM80_03339 [Trypanosoma rangeli]|uniref:Uncharacterized protein n=1 Tax=Trypanosoma rangeli TaxID=5698 RepID=A0A422NPE1_TRYRA|nr:uncharacterized protein TraAM80_03339 [Trypanosoma rangeli]RNF07370.1 hypothetical protein TraAM80_03339 [Trypanosoma rangeli]|eukprot:RNF07370.1 hypothetical protein TraAM80_03339 [Trypanosoma rangeli]
MTRSDRATAQDILHVLALDDMRADGQPGRGIAAGKGGRSSQRCCPKAPQLAEATLNDASAVTFMRRLDAASLLLEAEELLQQRHQPAVADGCVLPVGLTAPAWHRDETQGPSWSPQISLAAATATAARKTGPVSFVALKESRAGADPVDKNEGNARCAKSHKRKETPPGAFHTPCRHYSVDDCCSGAGQAKEDGAAIPNTKLRISSMDHHGHRAASDDDGEGGGRRFITRRAGGTLLDPKHAALRAAFTAPVTATLTGHYDALTPAGREGAAALAALTALPKNVTHDGYDTHDAEAAGVHDTIFSLKETQRLRYTPPMMQDEKSDSSALPHAVRRSLHQRLSVVRSVQRDTAAALEEATQLLLQERKWVMMRCTTLYDRLELLRRHRTTMMKQLRSVHGDAAAALFLDTSRDV